MVKVTIRKHVVKDRYTGRVDTYDQWQILLGQRVIGYLAPNGGRSFVVKDLPEDAKRLIDEACQKTLDEHASESEKPEPAAVPAESPRDPNVAQAIGAE
jgi:hypothetical protein